MRHLYEHNIPIALATSSGQDSIDIKTTHHRELFKLFDHKVMGSSDPEVKQGKPEPAIFLVAAHRFPAPIPNPENVRTSLSNIFPILKYFLGSAWSSKTLQTVAVLLSQLECKS